jgi:hypothetical protein
MVLKRIPVFAQFASGEFVLSEELAADVRSVGIALTSFPDPAVADCPAPRLTFTRISAEGVFWTGGAWAGAVAMLPPPGWTKLAAWLP